MTTAKSEKSTFAVSALVTDWPRLLAIILTIGGIFVAGYMSWAEVTGNETVCVETGSIDCAAVQDSAYATTLGMPVAVMGLLGYMAILAVLLLEDQVEFLAAYGRTLVVAMALFGVIFQTYLTYVEAAVLEKWCQWCVASHILIVGILIMGVFRLNKFLKSLR